MADTFENFNRQVEKTQQYPMLTKQALADKFRRVDTLLRTGTRTLLESTHFVEDNLCYRLAEIAIGSIKAKIYRGRYVKSRRTMGQGVTVGSENSKILGTGFDLFKLSRTSRDLAVPLTLRVLRTLRLQNINYQQIMMSFNVLTVDYRDVCEKLAVQQQQLNQAERTGQDDLVSRMQAISHLIDQKKVIESRVGCPDPNMLYGAVALLNRYCAEIDKIQNEIMDAYYRSIPKVVREYAKSDLDALDMYQVGCIGLLHAVAAYDHRSNTGFARFARLWIRQRIRGFLKESGGPLVRLSSHIWEGYRKFLRAERAMQEAAPGTQILRVDVAKSMGWSIEKVDDMIEKVGACQMVNLDDDTSTDPDEFVEREATIVDSQEEDIELLAAQQEQVRSIVQHLTVEDRRLICLRYGVVELIENNQLDVQEVLSEIFRQTACKTLLHQYMAARIDTVDVQPIEQEDPQE